MSELGVGRPTKRRAGSAVGGLPVADSRPVLDGDAVLGSRCTVCRYPTAQQHLPWCPVCYASTEPARFARTGETWSSTVVAIPVGTRRPPFGLAYVDLDDGPRVLVHLGEPAVLEIGTRLEVTGTDDGDLVATTEVQR
ncbi:Zn-ribbon domain-containing OB-fold protein [Rhodococcus sp. NPDC057014]|uniref:Zn-ribbon domain-containing OB-fold protein n=1 Tax=unclassified Rhodococcus (in: high G+C Gram-positive bacteria) TaxID=192944 RepID=UPI0036380D3E